MTTLGWIVIGGGCGFVLGWLMYAPLTPLEGGLVGALLGLLIFWPLREVTR